MPHPPKQHDTNSKPGGDFQQRILTALQPLVTDPRLRGQTALRIMNSMSSSWHFTENSPFFDFEAKVDHVVARFAAHGLSRDAYIAAATRRVALFFQNPQTLIANIEEVAAHFAPHGLTLRDYLRAAVKQPQLFYQKPRTLIRNIERVARRFKDDGMTVADYVQAASRGQPSLFFRKPQTIIRHIDLITELYRKGLFDLPNSPEQPHGETAQVIQYMLRNPALFLMSEDNIALREAYALALHARGTANAVLRTPRGEVERYLAEARSSHDLPLKRKAAEVRRSTRATGDSPANPPCCHGDRVTVA